MCKPKILIVEDESIEAMSFEQSLTSFGYDVVGIASTGETALEKVADLKPDLVLMDIVLKGEMDGIEAAAEIKDDFDIPVVYITAHPEESAVNRAKLTSPYGYIIKPVNKTELKNIIELALYKHRMESDLKRSEEKYRSLFENATDSIMIRNNEGVILEANPSACKMFGYTHEELVGKSLKELISNRCNYLLPEIKDKIQSQGYYNYEILFLHQNGREFHAEASCRKIKYANQDSILCISRDISDRKKAEEALRESEKKYRTLYSSMNEGVAIHKVIYDKHHLPADYEISDFNPAYEKILGIKRKETLGKRASEVYGSGKPPYLEIYSEVAEKGNSTQFETYFEHRDKHFSISVFSPKRGFFVTVFEDITEQKNAEVALLKSEKNYRELVNNSMVGVYKTNLNGDILFANDAMAKIFHFRSVEDLKAENIVKLYSNPMQRNKIIEKLKKEGTFSQYEIEMISHTGEDITIILSANLVDDIISGMIMDITDSKKAEFSLQKSEERFRAVAESAVDAIVTTDINGDVLFCNDSLGTIFGYPQYEIIGKNLTVLMPDRFKKVYINGLERFKVFGEHRRVGKILITIGLRKDGSEFPFEMSLSAWKTGKKSYFTSIIRDITERKHMEDSLRESERNYRIIFENTGTATVIFDEDMTISDVNSEVEKLTGFKREEIVGKMKWTDFAIKVEHERLQNYFIKRKLDPDSAPREFETQVKDKNGNVKDILVTVANIPGTGKTVLSFLDITSRKNMEDKLHQAVEEWERTFDAVPDLIAIINNDYRVVRVNKAMADRLGVEPDDCVGLICYEAVHGSNEPHILCPHRQLLEDGLEHTGEIHEEHLGGDFIVSVSPLQYEGNLMGGVHVARDVTNLKNVEKELITSLHQKELLIKEIHHRVKNNLQIISSLLDLQEGYVKGDPTAVNVLKESQNRVKSMAMIHEKLYESPNLTHINFYDYIQKLVYDLFHSYSVKNNTIIPVINVDNIFVNMETAVPLGLIISELISNSIKYAFPNHKTGKISIDLHPNNEEFELLISDNGVGFPKNLDFRNIKSTLGLKLVNSLVKQIDGSIHLDKNQGTKFTIKFKEQVYKERI